MAGRVRQQKELAKQAAQIASHVQGQLAGASRSQRRSLRRRVWKLLWDDERGERRASPRRAVEPDLAIRPSAKRIVLFLGAGASVPHGYPATDQLLPAIWQALNSPDRAWAKWAGFRRWESRRGKRRRVPIPRNADDLRRVLTSILPGLPESADDFSGASIIDVISTIELSIVERHSPIEPPSLASLKRAPWASGGGRLGVRVVDPAG
jgi:hypothetical protein